MRKFGITAALGASALVAVAVLLVGVAPQFSGAADHLDTPAVGADGRTDINDVYAFTNGSKTVLVMTVNPLAGVTGFSPTTFSPTADYELKIDNDGDAVEDITYRFEFSQPSPTSAAPSQTVTLSRDTGAGFKVIAEGKVSVPSHGARPR